MGDHERLTGIQRDLTAIIRDIDRSQGLRRHTRTPGRCLDHKAAAPWSHQCGIRLQEKAETFTGAMIEHRPTVAGNFVHQPAFKYRLGEIPLAVLDSGAIAGSLRGCRQKHHGQRGNQQSIQELSGAKSHRASHQCPELAESDCLTA